MGSTAGAPGLTGAAWGLLMAITGGTAVAGRTTDCGRRPAVFGTACSGGSAEGTRNAAGGANLTAMPPLLCPGLPSSTVRWRSGVSTFQNTARCSNSDSATVTQMRGIVTPTRGRDGATLMLFNGMPIRH